MFSPEFCLSFLSLDFFFFFFLVILLFKMAPSTVLKCCLVLLAQEGCDVPYAENVLDRLHSGMNSVGIVHEFSVNESIVH